MSQMNFFNFKFKKYSLVHKRKSMHFCGKSSDMEQTGSCKFMPLLIEIKRL